MMHIRFRRIEKGKELLETANRLYGELADILENYEGDTTYIKSVVRDMKELIRAIRDYGKLQ